MEIVLSITPKKNSSNWKGNPYLKGIGNHSVKLD